MGGPNPCLAVGDDLIISHDPRILIQGSKLIVGEKDLHIVIGQIINPIDVDGIRSLIMIYQHAP